MNEQNNNLTEHRVRFSNQSEHVTKPEAKQLQVFLFIKIIFSNILKLKTQAIGISHTGTDSCRLWVDERCKGTCKNYSTRQGVSFLF